MTATVKTIIAMINSVKESTKNIFTSKIRDISCNFQNDIDEESLKIEFFRAEASVHRLSELNPYVSLNILTYSIEDDTDLEYLKQYQVGPITYSLQENIYFLIDSFHTTAKNMCGCIMVVVIRLQTE